MINQSITTIDTSYIDICIEAWLQSKFRLSGSQKTRKAYEDTLRNFRDLLAQTGRLLDPAANTKKSTPEALQHAVAEIALAAQGFCSMSVKGKEISAATYNQRLAILGSFYAFAIKRHFVNCENPLRLVDRARDRPYQSVQALDPAEVKSRMAAIDRSTKQGQRDWCLLAIAFQTGRRLSELAGLRWRHVQIHGEKVTLVFEHCKGGKTMRDTLPPSIAQALLDYLKQIYGANLQLLNGKMPLWVSFTRRAAKQGNVPPALTIRSVANICEKHLGTSKVHVTRHTWARTMEASGAKVSDIQARLGHESLATTGRYLAALKQADNPQGADIAGLFGLT